MTNGTCVNRTHRSLWAMLLAPLLLALALSAVARPAKALGLGQIQVRSEAGQPLVAEIPIISGDPTEFDRLTVRLASPDTFARIGLDPPQGIVSGLQFAVALDRRGEPVIRVTSPVPVQQSQLVFLIEVDWGTGRLVREYSALVDAPRTVAAPAQPAIVAPVQAPSNAIVRTPPPVVIAPVAPAVVPPAPPASTPTATPARTAPSSVPAPVPTTPPPASTPSPAQPQTPTPTPTPPPASTPSPAPASPPAAPPASGTAAPAPAPAPIVPIPVPGQASESTSPRADTSIRPTPEPIPAPAPRPTPAPTRIPPPTTPRPASAAVATAPAAAPSNSAAGIDVTVQAGDTLSGIVGDIGTPGVTLDQAMIALLRTNPDAFIDGNLNRIRRGATLRVPDAAAMSQYGAAEARALVREQISQWRSIATPAPQPVTVAGADASPVPAPAAKPPARSDDARLEIVPPSANSARRAGTQSGIDAGGEGTMLQQQELQQTKETLAARDAEVEELKSRLTDLEKLQKDQQTLLSMKDSELANVQKTLATRQAAPPAATTQQTTAPQAAQQAAIWPWVVGAVLVVLLAIWLLARRRRSTPTRPVFDSAALAASAPGSDPLEETPDRAEPSGTRADAFAAAAAERAVVEAPDTGLDRVAEDEPAGHRAPTTGVEPQTTEPAFATRAAPAVQSVTSAPPTVGATPTWHAGTAPTLAELAPSYIGTSINPAPAGQERIELARAYVDLGDVETARSLLQEVIDGGDATSRDQATRLLRELS